MINANIGIMQGPNNGQAPDNLIPICKEIGPVHQLNVIITLLEWRSKEYNITSSKIESGNN